MKLRSSPTPEEIEAILDGFDFEKVCKVFDFLELKWYGFQTVTPDDLRNQAKMLLQSLNEVVAAASSGGFTADREYDSFERIFVLEQNHVYQNTKSND